jgi:DNA-binding LacI/PurR family transcriptional regulator
MDIKKSIKDNKLRQWEIAENLQMSEFTLSRWLRRPEKLDLEKRDKIETVIKQLLIREV